MASADSKYPRCASPTLVHTRTSGSAIPTRVLISPGWFIPSSTTAICGRLRSCRSDSGRPIWLFRLPWFLNTGKHADRNSATISLVVVLPALPVIATTVAPDRRRTSRARSCSARVVSSTSMTSGGSVVPASATPAPGGPSRRSRRAGRRRSRTGGRRTSRRRSPRRSRRARANASRSTRRPIAVAASPWTSRPRVAFATSVALKGSHSTGQHTRVPARRRSSAVLATSTSSNGSTRSPITWYFS